MGSEYKRIHHPYDLQGRWYKLFIESDGSTLKLTTSDIEDVDISGTGIKFPIGFHVVDSVYDIHSVPHTGLATMAPDLYGYADGSQGIYKPLAHAFDYANIYVYGYFE